jgi:protein-tyrosine-phosphatase
MAEGILRSLAEGSGLDHVVVESAGTHAPEGSPASSFAVEEAARLGADIRYHQATYLTRDLLMNADLVLVMEREHRDYILSMLPPEEHDKVRFMRAFHPRSPADDDVPDPIGTPRDFYRMTAHLLRECCKGVIPFLQAKEG